MVRRLREEEIRLWALVAGTVKAQPGMAIPPLTRREGATASRPGSAGRETGPPPPAPPAAPPLPGGEGREKAGIEPNRLRRLTRERDAIEAVIDLHGLDQDRARAALIGFLIRARDAGHRAALVITGRGVEGHGVLRRRAPDWLAAPELREVVAGYSEAHRRHGGEGALYVALKRKRAG